MAARPADRSGRRVQLHRALSKLGLGSRAQAWEWIRAGEVTVDGKVTFDPLTWVDLDRQHIARRGQDTTAPPSFTLAMHKPRGVVTTRKDERGRRTVYDLLAKDLPWIFPAGRLDANSEGLLILTNDSALSTRLTEPRHHIPKTYRVTVRGRPSPEALDALRTGIELPDGPTRPTAVRVLEQVEDQTTVEMVLTEGRNRQVRRMWSAVGHRVLRLVRTSIGRFPLGKLPPGASRRLGPLDIQLLLQAGPRGKR